MKAFPWGGRVGSQGESGARRGNGAAGGRGGGLEGEEKEARAPRGEGDSETERREVDLDAAACLPAENRFPELQRGTSVPDGGDSGGDVSLRSPRAGFLADLGGDPARDRPGSGVDRKRGQEVRRGPLRLPRRRRTGSDGRPRPDDPAGSVHPPRPLGGRRPDSRGVLLSPPGARAGPAHRLLGSGRWRALHLAYSLCGNVPPRDPRGPRTQPVQARHRSGDSRAGRRRVGEVSLQGPLERPGNQTRRGGAPVRARASRSTSRRSASGISPAPRSAGLLLLPLQPSPAASRRTFLFRAPVSPGLPISPPMGTVPSPRTAPAAQNVSHSRSRLRPFSSTPDRSWCSARLPAAEAGALDAPGWRSPSGPSPGSRSSCGRTCACTGRPWSRPGPCRGGC